MGVSAIRLPKDIEKAIEEKVKEENIDKSTAMKQFLSAGIREYKKQKAIELYKSGKISLSAAAAMASVSVYEMIDILTRAGVKSEYSLDDMKKERKVLEKRL